MSHDHDVDGFQERSTSGTSLLVCDVPKLREISGKLSQVSDGLAGAHGKQRGRLSPTNGHGAGAMVVAAAAKAATGWYTHLSSLASRTATTGTDLMAAANGIAGADRHSASHLRRIRADYE